MFTALGMINMIKTHQEYIHSLRVILFTHDDMDGAGPAIVAKKFFKDKVKVVHCSNENVNDKVREFLDKEEYENYDLVFITDISVKTELAERINSVIKDKVFLFDHHKSALHLKEYDWAHIHVTYEDGRAASGSSLFYGFMRTFYDIPKYDHFIDLIRQYDTWEWAAKNNLEAKKLANLFSIYGLSEFVRRYAEADLKNFEFSDFENQLLDLETKKIQIYLEEANKKITPFKYENYNVAVVFAELYISELGNYIAANNPEYDFGAILNAGRGISLRGVKDEVDLSKIAVSFGGGGHTKASGFPPPEGLKEKFIKMSFREAIE